jgi:hypothetical protein
MPQATFPDPGPDDAEPDGFPPDEDAPGPEQGLYITLPAEQLTLAGFCQGGASDTMAPGPLLATVVDTVTGQDGAGLAGCSDDQLMGIISAGRRLESRSAWTLMAAIGEFARRAGTGVEGEFAADELAGELHMSQPSAAGQMDFATQVANRLPATFAALATGQIHPIHLRIIEEATRYLTDADAAKADTFLAGAAPGMTYGELRYAARKLVLKLDPDAIKKSAETRGWWPASAPPTRSSPAGSTSSSAPWTCAPPGSPAPYRTSGFVLTLICCRNATVAPAPAPAAPPTGKPTPAAQTSHPRTLTHPVRPAPGTDPEALEAPMVPVARAVPAPLPVPVRTPGRAWPPWSPSPSPTRPCKAAPTPLAKPAGSAFSTVTTPATWPPPQPDTPAPAGA